MTFRELSLVVSTVCLAIAVFYLVRSELKLRRIERRLNGKNDEVQS